MSHSLLKMLANDMEHLFKEGFCMLMLNLMLKRGKVIETTFFFQPAFCEGDAHLFFSFPKPFMKSATHSHGSILRGMGGWDHASMFVTPVL